LALQRAATVLQSVASDEADVSLLGFSALRRTGVGEAAELLFGWVRGGR
jgi:hypothetical protein